MPRVLLVREPYGRTADDACANHDAILNPRRLRGLARDLNDSVQGVEGRRRKALALLFSQPAPSCHSPSTDDDELSGTKCDQMRSAPTSSPYELPTRGTSLAARPDDAHDDAQR